MLLSIEDIKSGLDKEFLPLEPMVTGLRLVGKITEIDEVEDTEKRLGVTFPNTFSSLIRQYNFGYFTLGPIIFGSSGNYLNDLLDINSGVWWGRGQKPNDKIVIAISDHYTFILDVKNESVSVITSELNWDDAKVISSNFYLFFCGIVTIFLLRNQQSSEEIAKQVSNAVGSQYNEFWFKLAE